MDGQLVASGVGATLTSSWNTRPRHITGGPHAIEAIAEDAAGNLASAVVAVDVVK